MTGLSKSDQKKPNNITTLRKKGIIDCLYYVKTQQQDKKCKTNQVKATTVMTLLRFIYLKCGVLKKNPGNRNE